MSQWTRLSRSLSGRDEPPERQQAAGGDLRAPAGPGPAEREANGVSRHSALTYDNAKKAPEPRELLRRHGLRCTPGRLRVLALLAASERHLSSSEACEQLTRSGKAVHHTTVYRTLEALTAVGLTHAVHGPGATRYGITGEPHHHTVCQQCGHIAALASRHLTEAVGRIEELTGLRPDSSGSLLVFGRCSGCSG
ncbi:hypothetical protein GCM10009579_37220 [Streptomyces javensis]|uniref:Transcriptional repressor n=1 Tax=Streptomyces javensis TaxID=114698 RepID=A0ABP4HMP8_9ACTN